MAKPVDPLLASSSVDTEVSLYDRILSDELRELEHTAEPILLETCLQEISEEPELVEQLQFDTECESSGSDSCPSDNDELRVEFTCKQRSIAE
jgi:hypothetical protein